MPKETFFNLPDAKRDALIAVAIEEFADHPFAVVSISRIVARAGIAKGSFYQYFEDKEDLYHYLLELVVKKKMEAFSLDQPDPEHVGIFKYLHWIVDNGIRFEQTYPQLTRLAYRAYANYFMPQAFLSHARQETVAFYRRLVQIGQSQGDISPTINANLAASIFDLVLSSLSPILLAYMEEHQAAGDERQPLFARPEVLQVYHQAIDILERGLRTASPAADDGVSAAALSPATSSS